jgi:hypothetical protein
MKRLIIIFLILSAFSNTASGGFFGDIFKEIFGEPKDQSEFSHAHGNVDNVKCKIEYTQLDLTTGLEKNIKHTYQYNINLIAKNDSVMYLSAQDLTDEVNIWLNESENNVITDLTIINCKERKPYMNIFFPWLDGYSWSEYKGCEDEYNAKLIDFLERPNQWGYNVNKARLIKNYEGGCKDYGYLEYYNSD